MKISVRKAGSDQKVTIIPLEGRIDATVADDIFAALREMVNAGNHHLIIDMVKVTFISSSGLRILLSTAKLIHDVNGTLLLINLGPRVRKVFQVADLEDLFVFYETEEQALASYEMVRKESV